MSQAKDQFRFGFLTAFEADDDTGVVGGLLVTTKTGKPLEFQCTTPVKPNRTQAILFGQTLQPYLLGELIGKTLVERVSIKPTLILTDIADVLELRTFISTPVLQLLDDEESDNLFEVGHWKFRPHAEYATDRETATKFLEQVPRQAQLQEPLQRAQDALQETIRPGAVA